MVFNPQHKYERLPWWAPAVQCSGTIEGPTFDSGVVLWRRSCRNLTRNKSGYCHVHQLTHTTPGRKIRRTS